MIPPDQQLELRSWYLGRLRPKLLDAARGGSVGKEQAIALDRLLCDLFDPGRRPVRSSARRPARRPRPRKRP